MRSNAIRYLVAFLLFVLAAGSAVAADHGMAAAEAPELSMQLLVTANAAPHGDTPASCPGFPEGAGHCSSSGCRLLGSASPAFQEPPPRSRARLVPTARLVGLDRPVETPPPEPSS